MAAHRTLSAFGGDLRLIKTGERTGYLDIVLRAEATVARAADQDNHP